MKELPLVAHAVYRFDVGGMENGLVNLINNLPVGFADHAVIALTDANPEFASRIRRPGVRIIEMHKPPGQTVRVLPRMYELLRRLRPRIFHTRNVGTLELQLAAWAARVPGRVHGEHGWDVGDLDGTNKRMLLLRRALAPFVHRQIALSAATERYLVDRVGLTPERVTNICNGVDVLRFAPNPEPERGRPPLRGCPFTPGEFVVGAVGRVAAVKNLTLLVDAFASIASRNAEFRARARLAVIGDGPDLSAVQRCVKRHGIEQSCWFAGARADVPDCLRALDLLCLPSLAEGISNTVLESMASGLPVVATDVGGNRELVAEGESGFLTPTGDIAAMASRIEQYFTDASMRLHHSTTARRRAVTQFSLQTMVDSYHAVYTRVLESRT